MDQHPYYGLVAACLAIATAAIVICLGITAWFLTEKARAATFTRRGIHIQLEHLLEDRARNAQFQADAAAFLARPIDTSPIDGDEL